MYADLTRMMMPASLRDAALDQGRRGLAFQQELVSCQLAGMKTAEEQAASLWRSLWELSVDNSRKACDQAIQLQDQALSSMTPATDAD